MNTKSTVEIIVDAADEFDYKAKCLRSLAKQMERTGDWSIAGEAISVCCNFQNIRIDLLSVRPVRELQREIDKINKCIDKEFPA